MQKRQQGRDDDPSRQVALALLLSLLPPAGVVELEEGLDGVWRPRERKKD